jgi:predicted nucleotidyltransferase
MISREDKKILGKFSRRVRERFPKARMWAFGSRAKGTATWESDLDICVVLDRLDDQAERYIRNMAWEIGFEMDRVITTVILASEQFERGPMSESSLVRNILQEGIAA